MSKQRHEWISTDCPMIEAELDAKQERIAALEAALKRLYLWVVVCHPSRTVHDPSALAVAVEQARAALAGSQGGGGEDGQDVACTETVHRVQEGADACVCGENRMELLL